jgi:hypothetical protein
MTASIDNRRTDQTAAMAGRFADIELMSSQVAAVAVRTPRSTPNGGDYAKLLEGADQVIAAGIEAYIGELHMPDPYHVASVLLTRAGLDPRRTVSPLQGARASTMPDAVQFYVQRDSLSARDVQRISGRPLSAHEILDIQGRLPTSLRAEFDRRFDRFANALVKRMAKFVQIWVASLANREGIADAANARITISRPTAYYPRPSHAQDRVTELEMEGDGYLVSVQAPGSEHRYFLAMSRKRAESIPAGDTLQTWVDTHSAAVFGEWKNLRDPDLSQWQVTPDTRVTIDTLGSGRLIDMARWFTASALGRIEMLKNRLSVQA